MQSLRTFHLTDLSEDNSAIKKILSGLGILILLSQGIVLATLLSADQIQDAQIIGISMIPIISTFVFIRYDYIETAGIILASSLGIMITILATFGHGIYDIGTMAFPAILIIGSLVLKRRTVFFLTALIALCNAWLIIGAVYGVYNPIYPQTTNVRQFIITTLIIIITMVAVNTLSDTIRKSLLAAKNELRERRRAEQALREAETLYRTLVENTSVVVYRDLPDEKATVVYISPQIEDLLGYSPHEWMQDPHFWQRIVHPDDLQDVLDMVTSYITSGEKTISEYRLKVKSGGWKWIRDEAIVIKDDHGVPQYVHGVFIDITEQKEALLAVIQREAILGAVAECAQVLLKASDWRGTINGILQKLGEASKASHVYIFENHPGADNATLSSQKYEWVAPGIKSELNNPVYQNTRLVPVPGIEAWHDNIFAGKPFYGSSRQYPRYWKNVFEERGLKTLLDVPIHVNGELWGVIGFDDYENEMPWSQAEIDALVAAAGNIGTAIERQKIDHDLHISEEKFQLAFHHTPVAMAINKSNDHTLLDANDAFCKITGYTREEAIGKRAGRDLNIWAQQKDRDAVLQMLESQGYVDEYKAEFRRKDGEIGVGLLSVVNVSIDGEVCQLFSFYDISRIEHLLEELKVKNDELQSFTYTVSHDLKAPLVTISGFMGYVEQDARNRDMERLNKDIQRINDAIQKMQRLLSELLELSRIGRMINLPEEIPFGDVVLEALELVQGRLKEKEIRVQVAANLPSVIVDKARMVEVIQNLVDNSAKFMGEQTHPLIEIGTEKDNDSRVFYVRDNGIGIEKQYLEKIFGLFNKLDNNTEGTGIGLALVKRIIEVHGGKIWVESDGINLGSTFYFTLGRPKVEGYV